MVIFSIILIISGLLFFWIAPKKRNKYGAYSAYLWYAYFAVIIGIGLLCNHFENRWAALWIYSSFLMYAQWRSSRQHDDWQTLFAFCCYPVIAGAVLFTFIGKPYSIPSNSMLPLLQQKSVIWAWNLPFQRYDYGDVVIFDSHIEKYDPMIKRIVGCAGDTVTYTDHALYVNGKKLTGDIPQGDYSYQETRKIITKIYSENNYSVLVARNETSFRPNDLLKRLPYCDYQADSISCRIPDGHYFMLGDNREHSTDSRYFGAISEKNIKGRLGFRIL